ncbi:MAG: cyclophilin-like fold protein [Candidatus Methanomethylophilus sp.]|nr:cyclophilin-like fold protein [Methanomethylophilus sp.]
MMNVIITDGTEPVHAVLNDTVAAQDFAKRLPFQCSGYDSGIDYCCTVADGRFDPLERQTGWKNGDISLGSGWFALLYGGEEESSAHRDMMIIGHIRDEDLPLVRQMPKKVRLTIRAV